MNDVWCVAELEPLTTSQSVLGCRSPPAPHLICTTIFEFRKCKSPQATIKRLTPSRPSPVPRSRDRSPEAKARPSGSRKIPLSMGKNKKKIAEVASRMCSVKKNGHLRNTSQIDAPFCKHLVPCWWSTEQPTQWPLSPSLVPS